MNTFTLTYRDGSRLVDRVIEARDRREAFKIAQRHKVNPVKVVPGGQLPREGDFVVTPHTPGTIRILAPKPWYPSFASLRRACTRLLFWR